MVILYAAGHQTSRAHYINAQQYLLQKTHIFVPGRYAKMNCENNEQHFCSTVLGTPYLLQIIPIASLLQYYPGVHCFH
jgi:hypothetical protein